MPLFFAMKHKYTKALSAVVGFIIVGWLSFMRPDWLLMFGIFTGICSYLLLALVFTKVGNLTLGDQADKMPLATWFVKLCVGQFSLLLLTLVGIVAIFSAGPGYSLSTVNTADLQQLLIEHSPWQWGPFPWGVIGIWGLCVAFAVYVKHGQPYVYQLGYPVFPKRLEPMLKSYIESTTAGATTLLLSLMVTIIVLLFTYIVDFQWNVFHFTMPVITVILLSFIGPFSSLSDGRKILRKLAGKQKATLSRVIIMLVSIFTPVMILAGFAGIYLLQHRPDMQAALTCKECGNYFANVPVQARLGALYWGWWLLWTPLAGSYVAKISKGRTIREFILGLYAIPLLLVLGWFILRHYPLNAHRTIPPEWVPGILSVLAAIALIVTLWVFRNVKDTTLLLSGYMKPTTSRTNRLYLNDASKVVGITLFTPKLLMGIIGTLFLHTTAGWFGIQLQVAAMGAMVMNAVYVTFNLGAYQFFTFKKK